MKCNQSRPGFELVSLCPFPTTITITPPSLPGRRYGKKSSLWVYVSPPFSHRNIILLRIKCERYIFIKKCVRSFIEVRKVCLIMFLLIFVLQLYNSWVDWVFSFDKATHLGEGKCEFTPPLHLKMSLVFLVVDDLDKCINPFLKKAESKNIFTKIEMNNE